MGVIKQNAPAVQRATPFSMADIEQQARAVLMRARQQAAQLLVEAQRGGEEIKKQSKADGAAQGFAEGFAKGREEGAKSGHEQALQEHQEQFGMAIGALNTAAEAIEERRRELDSAALRDVVGLAIKIAERITKRQALYDPEIVLANVGECLRLVVATHDIRIAVHPTQRAVLADAMPRLKMEFPALQHIEVTEDQQVAPGGCRIFTRQGQIDADLDTQLARIASELIPAGQAT